MDNQVHHMKRHKVWDYMRIYPPALCRLLARKYRGRGAMPEPMSNAEIAAAMGISDVRYVEYLATRQDWTEIALPTAVSFLKACGMDWASGKDMHRARVLIAQGTLKKLTYLKRSPLWETELKHSLLALRLKQQ